MTSMSTFILELHGACSLTLLCMRVSSAQLCEKQPVGDADHLLRVWDILLLEGPKTVFRCTAPLRTPLLSSLWAG